MDRRYGIYEMNHNLFYLPVQRRAPQLVRHNLPDLILAVDTMGTSWTDLSPVVKVECLL